MNKRIFEVTLNEDTFEKFRDFCESVGIDESTAINLFITKTVQLGRIPFSIGADNSSVNFNNLNNNSLYSDNNDFKNNIYADSNLEESESPKLNDIKAKLLNRLNDDMNNNRNNSINEYIYSNSQNTNTTTGKFTRSIDDIFNEILSEDD